MKIAYLVLTHTDPEFLARVSYKLTYQTDNKVFVHVDQKVDMFSFKRAVNELKNVKFLEERFPIFWGV